jgi:response regulator RpfG family c-di-GMP phosphodiesterase
MQRILVVDDEVQVAKALQRLLRKDYEVEVACNAEEALARLDTFKPDLVISDFRMPGMNGAAFLSQVRQRMPLTLRLILSGNADLDSALEAINQAEVYRFLRKPWDEVELRALIHRVLQERGVLTRLCEPFYAASSGVTVQPAHNSERMLVAARTQLPSYRSEDALDLIVGFVGELSDTERAHLTELLTHHAGRVAFSAEIGGERRLTLELPVQPSAETA